MDILKELGIAAGFLTIIAGALLAWRQSALTWQHVIVFCLGGVLTGISGVQLQAGPDDWSVNIGQIEQSTNQLSSAAISQNDLIANLDSRVDALQKALQTLQADQAAKSGNPVALALPPPQQKADFAKLLFQSRQFSQSAFKSSQAISLKPGTMVQPGKP